MYNLDLEYLNIVKSILSNNEFNKIKDIKHHGTTRFDHSLKVSFLSYKVAKMLHLNYEQVARGGLLHDFYISPENRTMTYRFKETFNHPKKAVNTASKCFHLSNLEKDIIRSHMFPIYTSVPHYFESWIVSFVDKMVAIYEVSKIVGIKFAYGFNVLLVFMINFIK